MGNQEPAREEKKQAKGIRAKSSADGPSKTPVGIVLGLVIIIKPITLADFALVGLVSLAVLMIYTREGV